MVRFHAQDIVVYLVHGTGDDDTWPKRRLGGGRVFERGRGGAEVHLRDALRGRARAVAETGRKPGGQRRSETRSAPM